MERFTRPLMQEYGVRLVDWRAGLAIGVAGSVLMTPIVVGGWAWTVVHGDVSLQAGAEPAGHLVHQGLDRRFAGVGDGAGARGGR